MDQVLLGKFSKFEESRIANTGAGKKGRSLVEPISFSLPRDLQVLKTAVGIYSLKREVNTIKANEKKESSTPKNGKCRWK